MPITYSAIAFDMIVEKIDQISQSSILDWVTFGTAIIAAICAVIALYQSAKTYGLSTRPSLVYKGKFIVERYSFWGNEIVAHLHFENCGSVSAFLIGVDAWGTQKVHIAIPTAITPNGSARITVLLFTQEEYQSIVRSHKKRVQLPICLALYYRNSFNHVLCSELHLEIEVSVKPRKLEAIGQNMPYQWQWKLGWCKKRKVLAQQKYGRLIQWDITQGNNKDYILMPFWQKHDKYLYGTSSTFVRGDLLYVDDR